MPRLHRACASLIAILLCVHVAHAAPSELDANLAARANRFDGIGIIVGVLDHGGLVTRQAGHLVDSQPLDENTVFEIGSITKVFTGTLLAQMTRSGKIALNDPIQKYLPPTVIAPTFNGTPIRITNLAEHNSGLPRDGDYSFTDPDAYARYDLDRVYGFLARAKLAAKPGEQPLYSNFGAALLGDLLARRAGMPYRSMLATMIFAPLGMNSSDVILTPSMAPRLAPPMSSGGTATESLRSDPALQADGAILSTLHDMVLFLRANLEAPNGKLGPALQFAQQPRVDFIHGQQIGLFWLTDTVQKVTWHNGGTAGYHTFIGFNRAQQRGVVVLSNQTASIDDIGWHILAPEKPLKSATPVFPLPQSALNSLAGTYHLDDHEKSILKITAAPHKLDVAAGSFKFVPLPKSASEFFSDDVHGRFIFTGGKLILMQPGQPTQTGTR
jgi:serine-type D-Ala-D-Ala carboxypeptidase/endopeptidase